MQISAPLNEERHYNAIVLNKTIIISSLQICLKKFLWFYVLCVRYKYEIVLSLWEGHVYQSVANGYVYQYDYNCLYFSAKTIQAEQCKPQ